MMPRNVILADIDIAQTLKPEKKTCKTLFRSPAAQTTEFQIPIAEKNSTRLGIFKNQECRQARALLTRSLVDKAAAEDERSKELTHAYEGGGALGGARRWTVLDEFYAHSFE